MPEFILTMVVLGAFALIVIFFAVSKLLLISQPNEVIILSGRKRTMPDGTVVGYRIIKGGRALRLPFLEKASRMSLETIPIELSVSNAYSKGGIPLIIDAIANIKINSKEPDFGNAVERFLTMSESDIHAIAKETLEGNLRGVLAALTPEEVNEDRLKFADTLMEEADIDLQKLGLQLDTLKITNISDESGYLNSIGRGKTAEVIARAKKAEAEKNAESQEAEAASHERAERAKIIARQNIEQARIETDQQIAISEANKTAATQEAEAKSRERAEKAQVEAEQNVLISKSIKEAEARETEALAKARYEQAQAVSQRDIESAQIEANKIIQVNRALADQNVEIENNNLRLKKADLEKIAIVREQEAAVAGEKAKAKFEQELETERIDLQQKRLMADVIEPAKARKEAAELEAKGQAASIIENGNAEIEVLKRMIDTYKTADGSGDKILMLKMLPEIIDKLTSTIQGITIDKITMVDNGGDSSGNQIQKLVNQLPGSVVSLSEMLENATGVDILSHFKKDKDTNAE